MFRLPDFVVDSTNVYRTKYFIIKQSIDIQYDNTENNSIVSHDTFYKRTKSRDRAFEYFFKDRKNINGKRLPSTMYTRMFVD